jgi:ADP-heptose:LPS heptosyltransferase
MKYPIYNPVAYWTLFLIDWILDHALSPFLKKNFPIPPPKKILLCNTAHLGDVILTTALLPVLKRAFPDAKIGMLVGSWSSPIVENHPLVEQVHTIDHWKVNRKLHSSLQKFYHYFKMRQGVQRELRTLGYDLAIDSSPHFPNMSYLLWRVKIPTRIGFVSAGFAPLLTHTQNYRPENRPIVEAFFTLLADLNLQPDHSLLRPLLNLEKRRVRKDYLVIHIGAGKEESKWVIEKWRELAKRLIQEGESLLFTGKGEEENRSIQEVIRGLPRAQNLCDQLTWKQFVATLQEASLLIGVDTSAGHIAAAVDTPALLLYTGIHPPKLWAPYGEKIQIVTHPVSCSPCFRGCKSMACIRSITVEQVYQAVRVMKPEPSFSS